MVAPPLLDLDHPVLGFLVVTRTDWLVPEPEEVVSDDDDDEVGV